MTEIRHKITGSVLWSDDKPTVRESLEAAVAARANLDGANLDGANLARANLARANLDGASLYGASLYGASLYGANLYGANLYGANLYGANLARANLYGASLEKLKPLFAVYPQVGVFSAFKKAKAPCGGEAVLLMEIQDGVPRCNALSSRKGRAQSAYVKALVSGPAAEFYISKTDTDASRAIKYVVGETVTAHEWCDDVRVECAPGIHFFLTREEAEAW